MELSPAEEKLMQDMLRVPSGDWIALSSDQSILAAHHPDLPRAVALAIERGFSNPVVMKCPPQWGNLVGPHFVAISLPD